MRYLHTCNYIYWCFTQIFMCAVQQQRGKYDCQMKLDVVSAEVIVCLLFWCDCFVNWLQRFWPVLWFLTYYLCFICSQPQNMSECPPTPKPPNFLPPPSLNFKFFGKIISRNYLSDMIHGVLDFTNSCGKKLYKS